MAGSGVMSHYLFEDIRLDHGAFTAVSLSVCTILKRKYHKRQQHH